MRRVVRTVAVVGASAFAALGCVKAVPESVFIAGEEAVPLCRRGTLDRCVRTAWLLDVTGTFGEASPARALYERACGLGHERACARLAVMAEAGREGEPRPQAARALYQAQCERGNTSGCEHVKRLDALQALRSAASCDAAATPVSSGPEGLPREVIARVIGEHMTTVEYCLNRRFLLRPDLSGRLALRMVVGPDGALQSAEAAEDTVGDEELRRCMLGQARTWRFPCPPGGGTVVVNYPFLFNNPGASR